MGERMLSPWQQMILHRFDSAVTIAVKTVQSSVLGLPKVRQGKHRECKRLSRNPALRTVRKRAERGGGTRIRSNRISSSLGIMEIPEAVPSTTSTQTSHERSSRATRNLSTGAMLRALKKSNPRDFHRVGRTSLRQSSAGRLTSATEVANGRQKAKRCKTSDKGSKRGTNMLGLIGYSYLVALLFVAVFFLLANAPKPNSSLSNPRWSLLIAVVLILPLLLPGVKYVAPYVRSVKISDFEVSFAQVEVVSSPLTTLAEQLKTASAQVS